MDSHANHEEQPPRPKTPRKTPSRTVFRESVAAMFSKDGRTTRTASSSSITFPLRRWASRTARGADPPSTPLRDVSNAHNDSPGASNSTSFLPELNSTPPMPTFQKPTMTGSVDHPVQRMPASSCDLSGIAELDSQPLRPKTEPVTIVGMQLDDRVEESPPLPAAWDVSHDRAICLLDARSYQLPAIVDKIRRAFPELHGGLLTPAMVDRRLRQLDQDVEIDYWRIGLRTQASSPHFSRDAACAPTDDGQRESGRFPTPSDENLPPPPSCENRRQKQKSRAPPSKPLSKSRSAGHLLLPSSSSSSSALPLSPSLTTETSAFFSGYRSRVA